MGLLVTHLIIGFEPEHARRRDGLADEIKAIATDPSTEPDVLLAVGQTRVYDCIEDPTTLAVVADRLTNVAVARRDLRAEIGATFAQALAALDLGDRGRLLAACDHHETVAARLDDPRDHSQTTLLRSTIAFIEGRYDDAAALSDES